MNYEMYPLAATSVDWKLYSEQVKKILNIDPLKGLGASYIDRDLPSSYLATLDLENHPLNHLREGVSTTCTFEHFSVSFIGFLDSELFFTLLCTFPSILTISKESSKISHFVILTANMSIWHHTVRSALSLKQPEDLRNLFHLLLMHFEQMGFKEVWSKYERKITPNGSLIFT